MGSRPITNRGPRMSGFILSAVLVTVLSAAAAAAAAGGTETPWVSVTVSPLLTTSPKRQLELSWAHVTPQAGDWVGLFASDPSAALARRAASNGSQRSLSSEALAVITVDAGATEGRALSGIAAPGSAEDVTHCAAYVRPDAGAAQALSGSGEQILAQECARMYPDWMGELSASIGGLRLNEVLLPGTHDSGAYRIYSSLRPQTLVEKYSITQEEDIGTQLELGARYLDIRVAYYPTTSQRWWINHGVVRLHPLQDALDAVKSFVQNHPQEIVIFDVQEFPVGFGDDLTVHRALVAYLTSELSELTVPPSLGWDATLSQVWAQRGRVILAYDRSDVIADQPSAPLWSAVRQLWGDVRTLDALRDYLRGYLGPSASAVRGPTAAMAELTPNALDVVLDSLGGLRKMADSVNGPMTDYLRDEWAAKTNAFAVDFVRGTDVIRVAVEYNRQRGEAQRRRSARGTSAPVAPSDTRANQIVMVTK